MSTSGTEILCLLGSSRGDGNTRVLVDEVLTHLDNARLIDLNALDIAPYDYQHRHDHDDFRTIAEAIDAAKIIIFATPVYWYAMSAQMKTTFDRLTDLTENHKEIGKRLKGKTAFALINGEEPLPQGFLRPFSETAGYFDMNWGGALTISIENKAIPEAKTSDIGTFAEQVSTILKSV